MTVRIAQPSSNTLVCLPSIDAIYAAYVRLACSTSCVGLAYKIAGIYDRILYLCMLQYVLSFWVRRSANTILVNYYGGGLNQWEVRKEVVQRYFQVRALVPT